MSAIPTRTDEPTADTIVAAVETADRRRRWTRPVGIVLLVGAVGNALVVGIPLGIYATRGVMDRRAYERELDWTAARNKPMTSEAVEALYPADAAREATTALWLAALEPCGKKNPAGVLVAFDPPQALDPSPWNRLPLKDFAPLEGERLAEAKTLLEPYRDAIARAHEARRAGGAARYPVEFALSARLDHLQRMTGLQRALALDAEVRLAEGDAHAAAENVVTLLAAAESLRDEPFFASQAIRGILVATSAELARRLLERGGATDERLAELQDAFAQVDTTGAFDRGLSVERFLMVAHAREESAGDDLVEGLLGASSRDANAAQTLAVYRVVQEASDRGPLEVVKAQAEVNQITGRNSPSRLRGESTFALRNLLFDFDRMAGCILILQARADLAETGLACERYRRSEGDWPATLADLVPSYLPAVLLDPFAGSAMTYRVDAEGPTLYSIGANQLDDGGVDPPADLFGGDIVFRLEDEPLAPPESADR